MVFLDFQLLYGRWASLPIKRRAFTNTSLLCDAFSPPPHIFFFVDFNLAPFPKRGKVGVVTQEMEINSSAHEKRQQSESHNRNRDE
jgi:hypothetical protein